MFSSRQTLFSTESPIGNSKIIATVNTGDNLANINYANAVAEPVLFKGSQLPTQSFSDLPTCAALGNTVIFTIYYPNLVSSLFVSYNQANSFVASNVPNILSNNSGIVLTIANTNNNFILHKPDTNFGNTTFTIATSPDGNTWTLRDANTANYIQNFYYANNTIIGWTTNQCVRSTDNGNTWIVTSTQATSLFVASFPLSIMYGNNTWVVGYGAGGSNPNMFYSVDNGSSWTPLAFNVPAVVTSIAYGNGKFVVIFDNGTYAYSSDGINYTVLTSPSGVGTGAFNRVFFTSENKFIWFTSSQLVLKSSDGITWTRTGDNIATITNAALYKDFS